MTHQSKGMKRRLRSDGRQLQNAKSEATKSKLKRPRRSIEGGKTVSGPPVSESPPKQPFRQSQISELSSLVDKCTDASGVTLKDPRLGATALLAVLKCAVELLPVAPLTTIIKHAPKLPLVLMRAVNNPGVSATEVIKCFVYLSTKFSQQSNNSDEHAVKTSDVDDENDNEVTKRASKWALETLVEHLGNTSTPSIHANVFVEPWFTLHETLVSKQGSNISTALSLLQNKPREQVARTVGGILKLLMKVARHDSAPIQGLLSSVLESVASIPPSLKSKGLKSFIPEQELNNMLHLDVELSSDQHRKLIHCLTPAAQVGLLHLSDDAYSHHIEHLKATLTWMSDVQTVITQTEVIGEAAQKYAEIHWKLMDHVRSNILASADTKSLFRIPLSNDRVWMRGALASAAKRLGSNITLHIAPTLRHHVVQFLICDEALCNGRNIEAGVLGARSLYRAMNLKERVIPSLNWQATLFTMESVVERLIWACGRCARKPSVGAKSKEELARICCAIMIAIVTVRTVGSIASSKDMAKRRYANMIRVLLSVWNNKFVEKHSQRQEFWISSLFCIAVVSTVGEADGKRCLSKLVSFPGRQFSSSSLTGNGGGDIQDVQRHEIAWGMHVSQELENAFVNDP